MRAGHGERDLGTPNTAPPTPELHGINPVFLSSNPSRWSVEEVYEFIASLQGIKGLSTRTQVTCIALLFYGFFEAIPQGFVNGNVETEVWYDEGAAFGIYLGYLSTAWFPG